MIIKKKSKLRETSFTKRSFDGVSNADSALAIANHGGWDFGSNVGFAAADASKLQFAVLGW